MKKKEIVRRAEEAGLHAVPVGKTDIEADLLCIWPRDAEFCLGQAVVYLEGWPCCQHHAADHLARVAAH